MKNNGIHISEWVTALDSQRPFYLAIVDQEGLLSFTNSQFYTHFLASSEQAGQNSFLDVIHPGDREQLLATLAACSAREETITAEIRISSSFGRWVKWEISCIRKAGQVEKFLCLGYDIADEERLKKTTRILAQNYRAIVEDMEVGVLLQDAGGGIITANPKTAEIFNSTFEDLYSKKELPISWRTGAGGLDVLPYADTPFMKALRTGEAQTNVILNFQAPGGGPRTLLCNSQPLFEDSQTVPYSVVSTFQDITKEREFEKEAQARTALFAAFMDHSPYFTWIVDEEEKLVFANKTLLDYFQVDETAFGKKLSEIIPGPIAGMIHEKHLLALHCTGKDRSIIKSLMADGQEHIYQVIVFPVKGAAPGILIGGEALDITESYQARQEEKKISERLLYINKATSEAIWDWNMQTGQIYFNQALHELMGTDLGQVFGLDWCYQCIHSDDRMKIERMILGVLERKEQSWTAEYRFLCSDGRFKTMHNRGFIIYESGEAIRMIGSLQDVSEIRRLETQLVKQKLKQQKGTAEAIIKAQEDERTRIGHELHDNINQILVSGQLYLNVLDNDIDNFQEIKNKTTEILALAIEEIRILSRDLVVPDLKKGGLVASIDELVGDLCFDNLFEVDFRHSKTCDIEVMTQTKKITLFRIVQEQMKNIVKYSKAKKVLIALNIDKDRVRLEIKDDGEGFDPKGTRRGIGLSNIYERTRLYNGKAMLTTAPGKGCSIIVSIPFEDRDLSH